MKTFSKLVIFTILIIALTMVSSCKENENGLGFSIPLKFSSDFTFDVENDGYLLSGNVSANGAEISLKPSCDILMWARLICVKMKTEGDQKWQDTLYTNHDIFSAIENTYSDTPVSILNVPEFEVNCIAEGKTNTTIIRFHENKSGKTRIYRFCFEGKVGCYTNINITQASM